MPSRSLPTCTPCCNDYLPSRSAAFSVSLSWWEWSSGAKPGYGKKKVTQNMESWGVPRIKSLSRPALNPPFLTLLCEGGAGTLQPTLLLCLVGPSKGGGEAPCSFLCLQIITTVTLHPGRTAGVPLEAAESSRVCQHSQSQQGHWALSSEV